MNPARKGWTNSISSMPESDVMKAWGWPIRQLHHLKANTTDMFAPCGEHVATISWRVREHRLAMKKPPKGYVPPRRDPAEIDAICKAWINARRAERGEPPLPAARPNPQ
ncbi:MAG: hypothetical protein AB7P20_11465 [Rhizobiaceae bacterium]